MKGLSINDPVVAVICDFGISRVQWASQTIGVGTTGFTAPEILNATQTENKYTTAADVPNCAIINCLYLVDFQSVCYQLVPLEQESHYSVDLPSNNRAISSCICKQDCK